MITFGNIVELLEFLDEDKTYAEYVKDGKSFDIYMDAQTEDLFYDDGDLTIQIFGSDMENVVGYRL